MSAPDDLRSCIRTIRVSTRRVHFSLAVNDAPPSPPVGSTVTGPHTAADIARAVIGSDITECLLAIFLDARHRVTGYAEVARGTLNASRFTPRDVFVPALHANAAAVIVAHNHPSGDATPSRADRGVTVILRDAARLIGLPIADHLIVTPHDVWSFRERDGWDDTEMAGDTTKDAKALDAIASILRDPEWGVGMLEDIDWWVMSTGRSTADTCGNCRHVVDDGPDERCKADGCGCPQHRPEQTWDRH